MPLNEDSATTLQRRAEIIKELAYFFAQSEWLGNGKFPEIKTLGQLTDQAEQLCINTAQETATQGGEAAQKCATNYYLILQELNEISRTIGAQWFAQIGKNKNIDPALGEQPATPEEIAEQRRIIEADADLQPDMKSQITSRYKFDPPQKTRLSPEEEHDGRILAGWMKASRGEIHPLFALHDNARFNDCIDQCKRPIEARLSMLTVLTAKATDYIEFSLQEHDKLFANGTSRPARGEGESRSP